MTIHRFENGMTITDLKKVIDGMPEKDDNGEDYEVWMSVGRQISSQVSQAVDLNKGDLILYCREHEG